MEFVSMQAIILIINVFLTLAIAVVGYVFKTFISRVEILERRMEYIPSEARVRQLLEDKLEVIHSRQEELKSDIKDIKAKLDQIINIGLMGHNDRQ